MAKREADKRLGRSWYRHMHLYADPCARCGHPQWRHHGINQPACTYLGSCKCLAFQLKERTA